MINLCKLRLLDKISLRRIPLNIYKAEKAQLIKTRYFIILTQNINSMLYFGQICLKVPRKIATKLLADHDSDGHVEKNDRKIVLKIVRMIQNRFVLSELITNKMEFCRYFQNLPPNDSSFSLSFCFEDMQSFTHRYSYNYGVKNKVCILQITKKM
jgi:hypothetical protein